MSGHADKNGLLEWISKFEPKPRRVFVVHGEQDESLSFAEALKAAGFDAVCPEPGAVYDLADDVLLSTVPAPAAAAVPEGAAAYEELRVLGQRLLEIINRSNALSTNEQNRFAKQIEELVDFWENKAG
jgi:metallo-beta-lactamase family protein